MPGNYSLTSPGDIPQSGTQSIGYDPLVELLMGARTSDQGSSNQSQDTGGTQSQAELSQQIQDQLGQGALDPFATPDSSLTKPGKVVVGDTPPAYAGLLNAMQGGSGGGGQQGQGILGLPGNGRGVGGFGVGGWKSDGSTEDQVAGMGGSMGGQALGTYFGGPVGGQVGAQLGSSIGVGIDHGIHDVADAIGGLF